MSIGEDLKTINQESAQKKKKLKVKTERINKRRMDESQVNFEPYESVP